MSPEAIVDVVPFAPPRIGADEISEVIATLESGWLSTGPRVRRFEGSIHARHLDPILVDPASGRTRDEVAESLAELGIATSVHFPAVRRVFGA